MAGGGCLDILTGTLGGLVSGVPGRVMLADPTPTQQQNQMKAEVDALRSRLESLQAVASAAAADKADLNSKLQQAQQHLAVKNAEAEQLRQATAQALLDKAEASAAADRAATSEAVAALQASQAAATAAMQQAAAAQKRLVDKDAEVRHNCTDSLPMCSVSMLAKLLLGLPG